MLALRQRLEEVESSLAKSTAEMASLNSELATLVSALDDIKKRQGRRAQAPKVVPIDPPARASRAATAAAALLIALLALGTWGMLSIAWDDAAPPGLIETASAAPAASAPAAEPKVAAPINTPTDVEKTAAVAEPSPRPQGLEARPAPPPTRQEPRVARPTGYVGTLTIDAAPAGDVFVDRKSVGRTPVRLENLRAGSHLVWIERDGYRRWTRVVPVAANRVSRVSADLDPIPR